MAEAATPPAALYPSRVLPSPDPAARGVAWAGPLLAKAQPPPWLEGASCPLRPPGLALQPQPPALEAAVQRPASLPAPDSHPTSACSCPSLSLGYNPNTEPGTQFHCSEAVTWDSLPVSLAASARCYLMCGYILTATVYCR